MNICFQRQKPLTPGKTLYQVLHTNRRLPQSRQLLLPDSAVIFRCGTYRIFELCRQLGRRRDVTSAQGSAWPASAW